MEKINKIKLVMKMQSYNYDENGPDFFFEFTTKGTGLIGVGNDMDFHSNSILQNLLEGLEEMVENEDRLLVTIEHNEPLDI